MVKKCFFLNEEVIDLFNKNICIPTIEYWYFVGLLVQWNVRRPEMIIVMKVMEK